MNVLFATGEARPFAASGGLGDVAAALPKALCSQGVDCRVVLPLYESILPNQREKLRFLTAFSVPVSWRNQHCGVLETKENGVTYYFLDNEYYFKRCGLYGHYDDAERFAFFSRAVLEMIRHIDFTPDILHANDWQCGLIPVYHTVFYGNTAPYGDMRTVYTIHNIQYQGQYSMEILGDVFGLPFKARQLVEQHGYINLMKGGIETAHRVTTVSPSYAVELQDPWSAHGLTSLLQQRAWKLVGILNGIDTEQYDPAADSFLYAPYSVDNKQGKAVNKQLLQERLSLPQQEKTPLIGMVSRLVSHKGFDLVQGVFEQLMNKDVQLVILGSGEECYEHYFHEKQRWHGEKFRFCHGFVPELAQKIYAASDLFLMPSQSEPCGLSQMIACRYGAVPIVRTTGGLKDTIIDCGDGAGNGFTFQAYHAEDMLHAIRRALQMYHNTGDFFGVTDRAMRCDFGWERSAAEYIRLYQSLAK